MGDAATEEVVRIAVEGLGRRGAAWSEAYDLVVGHVREHPEAVRALAERLVDGGIDSLTCLDDALAFLPMGDWPAVVECAVRGLRRDAGNAASEGVLEKASLQCPGAVHPYLAELLELGEE